jgi:branched-subunit amino acid aminotransferase/4-amino-4-deoxychorismate lyase
MYIGCMRNLRHELYGESVFTSFRTFNGRVPALELHFMRLYEAVRETYFMKSLTYSQFYDYFCSDFIDKHLIARTNKYFRLTIYSDNTNSALGQKSFGLCDLKLNLLTKELGKPLTSLRLKSYQSPFSKNYVPIKSGSYFQNLLFKRKAMDQGFDDVIFSVDGNLVEASTSNLVFEKNGQFFYPSGNYFLQGITLSIFKKYCESCSILIHEIEIPKSTIKNYDHVFLLNSVQGLVSVSSIDEKKYSVDDDTEKLSIQFIKYCEEIYDR